MKNIIAIIVSITLIITGMPADALACLQERQALRPMAYRSATTDSCQLPAASPSAAKVVAKEEQASDKDSPPQKPVNGITATGDYSVMRQLLVSVSPSIISLAALFGLAVFGIFGGFNVGTPQLAVEASKFTALVALMGVTFYKFFYPAMQKAKKEYMKEATPESELARIKKLRTIVAVITACYLISGMLYFIYPGAEALNSLLAGFVNLVSSHPVVSVAVFNTLGNLSSQLINNRGFKSFNRTEFISAVALGFFLGGLFQLIYFIWQSIFADNATFFGKASRAIVDPFFGGWICVRIMSTYYAMVNKLKEIGWRWHRIKEKGLWNTLKGANSETSLKDWGIPGIITIVWGFFVLVQYFNLNVNSVAQMTGIIGAVDFPFFVILNLFTSSGSSVPAAAPRAKPEKAASVQPAMVGIEDFIFGDKVIRAKTDVVKDSDKANFYYSANFYIDSEYIGHAGVSVGNGEIELYTCGNLEVVSDMREQKLGPLIVAKVFFAAAEEARNRNLIAPAWISATFDIASRKDYGGDDDVERDVSRTVGLLERLGLRRYQTEFKAGKLPDADLQQLMEKHSARNPDEWITFYARLSDLRKIVTERRGQSTVSNVSSASPSAGKVARAMPDDPLARDLDEKTETAIIETSLKDADHSSGFDENRSTLAALASAA